MHTTAAAALLVAAGLARGHDLPAVGIATTDAPRRLAGHVYFNAATGESVFTPAREYLDARAAMPLRALGDDINNDGAGDLWVNTNTDPCPIGTPTDPYTPLAVLDGDPGGTLPDGFPTPRFGDHHLYKTQLGPGDADVLVSALILTYWTDLADTDTDADTIPDGNTAGAGIELTFWDREDFFGKTSCFCPDAAGPGFTRARVATLRLTDLPGALAPLAPGELAGYVLTIDLTGGAEFEIADSDGIGPASGHFNPMIAAPDIDTDADTIPDTTSADTNANGAIDWSYSLRAIQPGDGRTATIAYQLAAPGRFGPAGRFAPDGVTPLNPQAGDPNDGLLDYIDRAAPPAPLQWANTRIITTSLVAPMSRGFPFTSGILPVPTTISRFSLYFASLGETPDPDGPPPTPAFTCAGIANSDFFGWGAVHPPDGMFYADLNCQIDDDADTLPDGRPYSGAFLALSESGPVCCPNDFNCDGAVNVDDIDEFATAFVSGDLIADSDGNGVLNLNDIESFVLSFLVGCL